jgi:hypothetical protein
VCTCHKRQARQAKSGGSERAAPAAQQQVMLLSPLIGLRLRYRCDQRCTALTALSAAACIVSISQPVGSGCVVRPHMRPCWLHCTSAHTLPGRRLQRATALRWRQHGARPSASSTHQVQRGRVRLIYSVLVYTARRRLSCEVYHHRQRHQQLCGLVQRRCVCASAALCVITHIQTWIGYGRSSQLVTLLVQ